MDSLDDAADGKFIPGEIKLEAFKRLGAWYNADGLCYIGDMEVLVLKTSGPYNNYNTSRWRHNDINTEILRLGMMDSHCNPLVWEEYDLFRSEYFAPEMLLMPLESVLVFISVLNEQRVFPFVLIEQVKMTKESPFQSIKVFATFVAEDGYPTDKRNVQRGTRVRVSLG
ncbi:hypothetical protein BDC45DRAFT_568346 [Circinella umbellata]|nr:hypothetical protein BDC45DRAFT_568346 [Circinella umbellata]